jgi:hypothetical protein
MIADDLKELYGEEYPAAIIDSGKRMPLHQETRFERRYRAEDQKLEHHISRFMDGSASITASELQQEWPSWDEHLRMDFCQNCGWLHEQADFPEMLRFIVQHCSLSELSAVALNVAGRLPKEEAFEILVRGLRTAEIGQTSNISQAISLTKHPNAEETLRKHLNSIWQHTAFWDDSEFVNWVAFDATTCIGHLIDLGVSPAEFSDKVRELSGHVCSHNRDSCRNFLSKHYQWLK